MGVRAQTVPVYLSLVCRVVGGLAATWILARRLCLDEFGVLAIAGSLGTFAWAIWDWGISIAGQRILGHRSADPSRRDGFIRDTIRFRSLLAIALGIPVLGIGLMHPALTFHDAPLLAAALLFGWSNAASPAWALPILQRNAVALPADIAAAAGTLACSFWLITDRATLPFFFLAPTLGNFGLIIWFLAIATPSRPGRAFRMRTWLHHFSPALGLRLAMTTLSLGMVMVYATVNAARDVAVYAAADRVLRYAITGLSPVFSLSAPWLFAARFRQQREQPGFLLRYLGVHAGLGLVVAMGMVALGPWAVHLVYGERFHDSLATIRWLAPAVIFWMLENAILTQVLVARGRDADATRVVLATATLTAVGVVLGCGAGVVGMAATTIAIEAALALGGLICLLRSVRGCHAH